LPQSSVTTDKHRLLFTLAIRRRSADGVQAAAASSYLYSSCRTVTAQAIRAILLSNGHCSSSTLTHAERLFVLPGSRRITDVVPMASKRLK
jgi:hypothetical protein